MPDNVIDELKVVLTLDPSKYTEAQKKFLLGLHDTSERARKTGDELETAGKRGASFFDQMATSALKLGAVLLGGVGIKDFIKGTTESGNAAFYLSKNVGISVEALGRWQNIARQIGADAAAVGPELLQLGQAITTLQLTGKDTAGLIPLFQLLGIDRLVDDTGKLKDTSELLMEIHKGLSAVGPNGLPKFTPEQQFNIVSKFGLKDLANALTASDEDFDKFIKNSDAAGTKTTQQAKAANDLTKAWGNFTSFMDRVGGEFSGEIDPALTTTLNLVTQLGEKLDKIGTSQPLSDIGALLGGIVGGLVGLLGGPIGVVAGATAGVALGGSFGAEADNKFKGRKPLTVPGVGEAARDELLSPGSSKAWTGPPFAVRNAPGSAAPAASTTPKGSTSAQPGSDVFNLIQKLEGGDAGTVTPTGLANDPYAYGKNQITLGTAKRYDPSATAQKLLDASYNDDLARKIQAELSKRYNGNLDAIAIAYHNGPGAADRFVATGGSLTGLGPQSLAYLQRERELAAAGNSSSTSSSTTHIGSINVNAPGATDANGIAASMRAELADYQLLSQGNAGPQ